MMERTPYLSVQGRLVCSSAAKLLRDTWERVILVQAEDANEIKLFGVRGLDGKEAVVKDGDLELLGTQKPR